MITERLMKPGNWQCRLKDNTPDEILEQINFLDHIVVLPAEVGNPSGLSDTALLAASMYTGVFTSRPTRRELHGYGLAWWLGDDQGVGDVITTKISKTAATLSTWMTSLVPASLTVGTVTNTGLTLTQDYNYLSRREAIDHLCRSVGAQWRVNHNGTVDAASSATLFPTTITPTLLVTKRPSSSGGAFTSIEATKIEGPTDVENRTTDIYVADSLGYVTGAGIGSYDLTLTGTNAQRSRLVNAPAASDVSILTSTLLGLYNTVTQGVVLATKSYATPLVAKPGDAIWVYDKAAGVHNDWNTSATKVLWDGEQIAPLKARVLSITHPFMAGYGVYIRHTTGVGTATWLDLTPYMLWEDSDTTWELGTATWNPANDTSQLGGAYLGVHPELINRLVGPGLETTTPTLANVTGGTVSMQSTRIGNRLWFDIRITAGTATAAAIVTVTTAYTWMAGTGATPLGALLSAGGVTSTAVSARANAGLTTINYYASTGGAAFAAGQTVVGSISGCVVLA